MRFGLTNAAWLQANGSDLTSVPDQQWFWVCTSETRQRKTASRLHALRVPFFWPLLQTATGDVSPLWPKKMLARLSLAQVAIMHDWKGVTLDPVSREADLLEDLRRLGPINQIERTRAHGKQVKIVSGELRGSTGKVVGYRRHQRCFTLSVFANNCNWLIDVAADRIRFVDNSEVPTPTVEPIRLGTGLSDAVPTLLDRNALLASLREFDAELITYLAKHPETIYSLAPRAFERLVADILADMGYAVTITPETRDGGRDILAVFHLPHGRVLTVVECKRFAAARPVGIDIVERFLWVMERKDHASCGLIAATSYFSPEARATERQYQYKLKLQDFGGIQDWLSRYGTWRMNRDGGLWLPETSTLHS